MAQMQVNSGGGATGAGSITTLSRFVVETSASWGDFSRQKYVEAQGFTEATSPSIGQAVLELNYGNIKREDKNEFANEVALNLADHYVRIVEISENGTNPRFYGVIGHDAKDIFGAGVAGGDQTLNVFGICHELDRETIATAKGLDGGGTEMTVGFCPDVNERFEHGPALVGNRSSAVGADGAYVFSNDGEIWTALDVCEMMVKRYTPANGPVFVLGGQKEVLRFITDIWQLEGKTAWQVLTEIISDSRGLGIAPIVQGETVVLHVFTTLDEAVSAGGITVPANGNVCDLNLDDSIEILNASIQKSSSILYDVFEVRGERILACGSFSYDDKTLEEGWTLGDDDTEEENYKIALEGTPKYNELANGHERDEALQILDNHGILGTLNDAYRQTDRFDGVFSKHRVPDAWNGASYGQGLIATCGEDGTVSFAAGSVFRTGKAFETFLPLREQTDYSVDPAAYNGKEGVEPEVRRPFALVKVNYEGVEVQNGYHHDGGGLAVMNDPLIKSFEAYEYTDRPTVTGDGTPGAKLSILPRDLAVMVTASPRHIYAAHVFISHSEDYGTYDSDGDDGLPVVDQGDPGGGVLRGDDGDGGFDPGGGGGDF